MEASTQGGGFQGSYSSGLLGLLFKVHGIFSNIDLLFNLWRTTKDNSNILQSLGASWTTLNYNSKECLYMPGVEDFVRLSMALWGSIVSQDRNFSLELFMYMCLQT